MAPSHIMDPHSLSFGLPPRTCAFFSLSILVSTGITTALVQGT